FSWVQMSNQARHTLEYLAITGPDNITRPMLAESWTASPDLKTWTFNIRKGVVWHTGEELTADHVAWNLMRWADPATASSNVGLSVIAGLVEDTGKKDDKGKAIMGLSKDGIQVVDKYTLRLNMDRAVLSAPEDLYNYPTAIVHPSFKAPLSDNMIGTGPFMLGEFKVGDKCVLKRVTKTRTARISNIGGAQSISTRSPIIISTAIISFRRSP